MKNMSVLALVTAPVLMAFPVWAEDFAIALPVTKAEVFPQGALLRLETLVDLPAGDHTLHALLPARLMQNDVPKLESSAAIRGIRLARTFDYDLEAFDSPAVAAARARVEAAQDAEEDLERAVAALDAELAALAAKADFLRSIGGGDSLPSAEDLVALSDSIVAQLGAVAAARAPVLAQIKTLEEAQDEARQATDLAQIQLDRLTGQGGEMVQVSVDVVSDGAPVLLATQLVDPTAQWTMRYEADLIEGSAQDRVRLERQVMIAQSSGLAWVDVALKLSTARPSGQISPSEVNRSIARMFEPNEPKLLSRSAMADSVMMEPMVVMEESAAAGLFTANFEGPVVSYDLPQAVTVYGQEGGTLLSLAALEFEAKRYLAAAPRFDTTAFVAADITNSSAEPIFEGRARYARNGVLVGEGYLAPIAAGAPATLGFGPEVSVALEVEFLDQQTGDRGFIRTSNTREEEVRVTLRNLSDAPRDVVMRYAVPTSQQEDLEIDVALRPAPTTRDADDRKGVMEWALSLAPGAEQAVTMDFALSWPEGQELNWRP